MPMKRLEKAAILSALGNVFVSAIKFAAGTAFGSIALVADAIHSFADIVGSVAVFFGVKFADLKSEKFPYGLYKLENFASLFVSLVILWSGVEILLQSLQKLSAASQIKGLEAISVAMVSLAVVYALAKYKEKVGREEKSPSMISEAKHSMLDAYGSVGVIAALGLSLVGYPIFDPLIGVLISLLVFKAGTGILIDSARVLMDISLDYKTMRKIEKIAAGKKGVRVKDLVARNSGRYVFVDLRLETDIKDLKRVGQLRKQCEEKIKELAPRIDRIMIDVEYKRKPELIFAVPLEEKSENSLIAKEFGTAKFFGLIRASNVPGKAKLLGKRIIENPNWKSKARKGILAAELLAKNSVDILFSKEEMHKGGAYYALQDLFVEVRVTGKKRFSELLGEFA